MDKNANLMKDKVMFYNSTPGIWLFPDGKVITSYYEAQQKADKLGMNLQMPNLRRFSNSH
ncbi:hypothetical protein SGGMMB4_02754 [Sodalis glossinidius str. 'morsitans']|uniref:Uncharacterized protein n=1 Tax=Sodalis glossinidius (strain morsitans) TaxID=343509 RepID=A0A193QJ45_SODGM|nr:hypothetical protein [Sodalis glossinidius]CRL45197.1 hypothetical protein SGGMMB4_02754 [Sodalis glossinidius str. 'morsitans']